VTAGDAFDGALAEGESPPQAVRWGSPAGELASKERCPPFEAQMEGDRLIGRGTAHNKAGIAFMLVDLLIVGTPLLISA
jgi:acetylornithine deacetylase/succinyl-diaminopimelate desuccinylase-like protein